MLLQNARGRVCYGPELQPAFVAVALERLKEMGLEPKLVEGDGSGS